MANLANIDSKYDPEAIEPKVSDLWLSANAFCAEDTSVRRPFSIILPPPNVTGSLHLGHALDHVLQDVLVRWRRMTGHNALWMPGTDHAGIATQSRVERELAQSQISRKDLGRQAFVAKVWEWKEKYGGQIVDQMKRLGDSCDWSRNTFTLDPGVSKAVRRVFVRLYEKGWIYKGTRLINWSPALESAISDIEVEHKPTKGHLWYLNYSLSDDSGHLTVATTRPETFYGDVAVAVNPDDERYTAFHGKTLKLPIIGREIPILLDTAVDMSFGTGAVKITPGHDFNDYQMGLRHKLTPINILNPDGTLNEIAGNLNGVPVKKARQQVVQILDQVGAIQKTETHEHSVGYCSRTGCVVEPYLSEQWFVKTSELAKPARFAVENGTTTFEPESWTKTYLHWLHNIEDWCISRQLWWGHQIPAWQCESCSQTTVAEEPPSQCNHCGSNQLVQDEDVLDTWFSSALWPFSTLGWPQKTEALRTFYPTSVLITGHDIIFFWVARMMMMGLEFMGDVPFRKVYIHGLVRDSKGRKMSKSEGNTVDPMLLIDKYGADALRFSLMSNCATGRDLKYSEDQTELGQHFMNKVWNACRFAQTFLNDSQLPTAAPTADLSDVDRWIIFKLKTCIESVEASLENFRFQEAAHSIYKFVWTELCDWYLELSKPSLFSHADPAKPIHLWVLKQVLERTLKVLHPFAPFITEELNLKLQLTPELLVNSRYPSFRQDSEFLSMGSQLHAEHIDFLCEVIASIRNIRGENRIKPSQEINVSIVPQTSQAWEVLEGNRSAIEKLAKIKTLDIVDHQDATKAALATVRSYHLGCNVIVPLVGLVNLEEEIQRLGKNLDKLKKERQGVAVRLGQPQMLANAPQSVIEEWHRQIERIDEQIQTLTDQINRLA